MNKNTKYLIFDFDGVLGNTFESRVKAIQELEKKTEEEIEKAGNVYFTNSGHTRKDDVSEEKFKSMLAWSEQYGKLLLKHGFSLFEEFIHAISQIENSQIAVVSSGGRSYVEPCLKNCKIDFSHILTIEDHHSKEEKVEKVCKDWNVSVKDIYFFTDTVSDVVELEELLDRSKIYGYEWGYQGYEKLRTVLPDEQILREFEDILRIFQETEIRTV